MARIGLVLGAGGSVGLAYHGGVLDALATATGWDPRTAEVIVGTSAGSLTAAMLRGGLSAADLACISEDRPLSPEGAQLRRSSGLHNPRATLGEFLKTRPVADPRAALEVLLRPWSRRPAAAVAALLPAGGVSLLPIAAALDGAYGDQWPASTWICAVRLRDGRRIVFGREGSPPATIGQAVAASCAIPGYFTPVQIGADRYVDGGVRSMLNLPVVRDLGLDLVVVSSPMGSASRWPALSWDAALRQALRVQLDREAGRVRARGTAVLALLPTQRTATIMGVNAMDASRRGSVSRQARASTLEYLERSGAGERLAQLVAPRPAGAPANPGEVVTIGVGEIPAGSARSGPSNATSTRKG